MNMKKISLAAALALGAVAAYATPAAVTASLGGNTDPATFATLSEGGNVNGGVLATASVSGVSAKPTDTLYGASYLVVNPSTTSAVFTVDSDYVSFEWGTPDTYNTLVVTDSLGGATSYVYGDLGLTNYADAYVSFVADVGVTITSLTFESTGVAFEAANFAVTSVPEPTSIALMLAGLGLFGFMARKRNI